jgi:hypothetical protein
MNINQVYSVGVTFHNVGESDSIEEAVAALKHLYKVTEKVFDRIETKVKTERSKIDAITNRLAQASAQIETIGRTRASKATTVFSNAKFPGSESVETYTPIFANMPTVDCPPDFMQENAPRVYPANDGNPRPPPPQADMLDLLWRANQTLDLEGGATGQPKGVGPLPDDLMSVTNFMLYNSNETPYTDYNERLDNMFEVKQRDAIEEETKRKMAAQGSTLLGGDQLPAVAGLDMTYKPTMKAQPTLQFQTNLDFGASLPAVASDAAWSSGADEMTSIAPSALQAALPALPALMDSSAANALPDAPGAGRAGPPAPSAPPPPRSSAAAPPPPPPPSTASRGPPAPRGARPARAPPANGPRPPPPLPPKKSPAAARKPAPAGGGRGSLLDAIKSGKRLKKNKERKLAPKKETKAGGGMSMMEQMKARLGRRANVMSGREDDESQKKNRKRRITVVGKTVTTLMGAANRAKQRVAAKKVTAVKNNNNSDDDSDSSFNSSGDDNAPAPLPTKNKLPMNSRPRRRSSEIADTIITKRPSLGKPEDKSVGGFSTKGMAGLTALLAHKSSSNTTRDRQDSVATDATDDDWDSD